jgi:hypothetical protein
VDKQFSSFPPRTDGDGSGAPGSSPSSLWPHLR